MFSYQDFSDREPGDGDRQASAVVKDTLEGALQCFLATSVRALHSQRACCSDLYILWNWSPPLYFLVTIILIGEKYILQQNPCQEL